MIGPLCNRPFTAGEGPVLTLPAKGERARYQLRAADGTVLAYLCGTHRNALLRHTNVAARGWTIEAIEDPD